MKLVPTPRKGAKVTATYAGLKDLAITTAIKAHCSKLRAQGKRAATVARLEAELKALVTLVVKPQLAAGATRLDLNDVLVASALTVSHRRAATLRKEAREAGIIFFPEYSRPREAGHYPIYLVAATLIVWRYITRKARSRAARGTTYDATYHRYLSLAKDLVRESIAHTEGLWGSEVTLPMAEYSRRVEAKLSQVLATDGLTRADLKLAA